MKTVEVLAISMLLLGNTVYGDCLLSWDEQASAEINVSKEMKKIHLIMDSYLADKGGVQKSKWKFKMAFAMKGGGVSRGSRVPHTYFEK